jgi:predicted DNA-binding transcriptional regulator AlpA
MQSVKRVLRTPEAAEYAGLSASTLEKLRLTGNGPAFQKAGPKIVVYYPDELDRWLSGQRRTSTSDPGSVRADGADEPWKKPAHPKRAVFRLRTRVSSSGAGSRSYTSSIAHCVASSTCTASTRYTAPITIRWRHTNPVTGIERLTVTPMA